MKLVSIVIIVGFILLYFINSAIEVSMFDLETFIHSGLRFLAGFFVLGIGVFYAHQIKLKYAIGLLLLLAIGDDIWDYTRDVNSFSFEVLLHSLYMLAWGALTGYLFMKRLMNSIDRSE